ncbi:DNA/RNA helicase domain-containing protein [Nocardiopsis sp. NPDC006139]|uniref:DNA/RNA helicase domain-containing protein n=1 Tax=unclassified Nocardiopsis TaxID=2649073 RepID=UPI0033A4D1CF
MSQTPSTPFDFVHVASVGDTARALQHPGFIERCIAAYREAGFGIPGESEIRSWRNSWPPLLDALVRAGLEDLRIYLEFGTPEGHSRFDALLLGWTSAERIAAVVVELKQWTDARPLPHGQVHLPWDDSTKIHPVLQVAGYTAFLKRWFDSPEAQLDVRGLALLHNATEAQVGAIEDSSLGPYVHPVLSGERINGAADADALRSLFHCSDVIGADNRLVKAFETASWRPNRQLLSMAAEAIDRDPAFVLMGDQQSAFLGIRAKVDEALASGRRSIVLVEGGPGSGKTILAMRLLRSYIGRDQDGRVQRRALYRSPSKTLNTNLREVTRDVAAAKSLFGYTSGAVLDTDLVILDEAHRVSRVDGVFERYVMRSLARVPVVVIFLDERQRIRPDEGLTGWEVRDLGEKHRIEVTGHRLRGGFRCNGSREFTDWVDRLLYGEPVAWRGKGYDLGVADDPSQLEEWLRECVEQERSARIGAGFCWSWSQPAPGLQLPGVSIEWHDAHEGHPRRWARPWNLHEEERTADRSRVVRPKSPFWATHAGGVDQVGCVYTAQGLEYDDAGVIIGPDLVRRAGHWEAHPEQSRDPRMRGVGPELYLELARNTYRVLMTRGMKSCRLYSTDEETREFLRSLMPTSRG